MPQFQSSKMMASLALMMWVKCKQASKEYNKNKKKRKKKTKKQMVPRWLVGLETIGLLL